MKIKGFSDTIQWYNENASGYAEKNLAYASKELISKFAKLVQAGEVLDAGCGAGRDTNLLKKAGFKVVGIDISQGMLNEAQRRYPDCKFEFGSFLQLPYQDNEFQGVWAHASLLHLESLSEVSQALLEFYRVLSKKGILHILVKAQTGEEKTAVVSDSLSGHERFFRYFTLEEIEALVLQAGFEVISSEQYREIEKKADARPEVELIVIFAQKP